MLEPSEVSIPVHKSADRYSRKPTVCGAAAISLALLVGSYLFLERDISAWVRLREIDRSLQERRYLDAIHRAEELWDETSTPRTFSLRLRVISTLRGNEDFGRLFLMRHYSDQLGSDAPIHPLVYVLLMGDLGERDLPVAVFLQRAKYILAAASIPERLTEFDRIVHLLSLADPSGSALAALASDCAENYSKEEYRAVLVKYRGS